MEPIIQVEHLRKVYGDTVAVDDISFEVYRGEIFGIIGPNGAGKTTAVESIIGLRQPDEGTIRVLGLDPHKAGAALRQRIGVQLQEAALPGNMKVREALDLFATFYENPADTDQLIEQWGLGEKLNTRFAKLSGGQQQRLFIALGLVNNPEITLLDELTTGLDPQARRASWDLVRAIRNQGKTVVLVTHFMDEAEALCDRVAIIDHGKLIALDTPRRLVTDLQAEYRVRFTTQNGHDPRWLEAVEGVSRVEQQGSEVIVYGGGPLMAHVAAALAERGITPPDLRTEQADLEDVFIALTGRQIRD